jgi:hypothetical protein
MLAMRSSKNTKQSFGDDVLVLVQVADKYPMMIEYAKRGGFRGGGR